MINESSLLINTHFALRQVKGIPVYTEIKTETITYSEQEIKDRINKINNNLKKNTYDSERKRMIKRYKEIYSKAHKNEQVKTDYPIDLSKLRWIIITHNAVGYISSAFLEFAKKNSIAIYWIDGKGIVEACFMPTYFKRASITIKQVESRINGKECKQRCRETVDNHIIPVYRAKIQKDSKTIKNLTTGLILVSGAFLVSVITLILILSNNKKEVNK